MKTRDVLKVIGVAGGVMLAVAAPGVAHAFMKLHKEWKQEKQKDVGRIIKRLQRQEMISVREKGEQTTIEITEKGRRRLLEYDFENIDRKAKKRDGKWRLIIFDIPEYKKKNRDAFRRKLLQIDCIRLQDSVFASAFPCKNEVDFLSHYLEITNFVTLLTVDKIERGEELLFKRTTLGDNDTL